MNVYTYSNTKKVAQVPSRIRTSTALKDRATGRNNISHSLVNRMALLERRVLGYIHIRKVPNKVDVLVFCNLWSPYACLDFCICFKCATIGSY